MPNPKGSPLYARPMFYLMHAQPQLQPIIGLFSAPFHAQFKARRHARPPQLQPGPSLTAPPPLPAGGGGHVAGRDVSAA